MSCILNPHGLTDRGPVMRFYWAGHFRLPILAVDFGGYFAEETAYIAYTTPCVLLRISARIQQ